VIQVQLPPLRDRLDDIPLLVRHFEQELAPRIRSPEPLAEAVISAFLARSWPGNVRELRNAVARSLSLGGKGSGAGLRSAPPPPPGVPFGPVVDLGEPLLAGRERVAEAYERAYIEAALRQTGGNVSRAAEVAQVNRKFIQRAMKRFGLRGDG